MKRFVLSFALISLAVTTAFAGHPLTTDDAETQGKGKAQIEIGSQYSIDRQSLSDGGTTKTKSGQIAVTMTYGPIDSLDIVLGIPYQWSRTTLNGLSDSSGDGVGDISLDLKWRFYEKSGWGFALKPGVTFPTGDSETGIGTGRATYHLYGIVTKDMDPWDFHLNLGYIHNGNTVDQATSLWHASLAAELEVVKGLKTVADLIVETNPEKTSHTPVFYALGGLVYNIADAVSIDGGVKFGLSRPAAEITYLLGLTFRF